MDPLRASLFFVIAADQRMLGCHREADMAIAGVCEIGEAVVEGGRASGNEGLGARVGYVCLIGIEIR